MCSHALLFPNELIITANLPAKIKDMKESSSTSGIKIPSARMIDNVPCNLVECVLLMQEDIQVKNKFFIYLRV